MVNVARNLSEIEPHQSVITYPSYGTMDREQRTWNIQIRGTVFEPCGDDYQSRLLVRFLQRAMQGEGKIVESQMFRHRVSSFLAQHKRGKRVTIRVGDKMYRLRHLTRRNGFFGGILRLSQYEVERFKDQEAIRDGWLYFHVLARRTSFREFSGRSQLISPHGISVISDIDDTIKRTNVNCRRELLVNTFLRDYEAIPGMSQLYRQWAESGAVFHYVSSSPWQLLEPLQQLCDDHQFPRGSYHLRSLRLRDPRVLTLLLPARWGKRRTIRSILKSFPGRKFILVGDSGERDPELYGAAARKFPQRVARIYIRDIASRSMDRNRIRRAFRRNISDTWRIFDDADQLTTDHQWSSGD